MYKWSWAFIGKFDNGEIKKNMMEKQVYIQWLAIGRWFSPGTPVQHAMLDFYSASSQKLIHQVDMSLHSDTLLWFQDNQSLRWVLSGEAIKTNFIVCSLTRPEPESTIYRTPDEYANHYITDAVFTYSLNKYCIVRTNCCFAFVCFCFYVFNGFWGFWGYCAILFVTIIIYFVS